MNKEKIAKFSFAFLDAIIVIGILIVWAAIAVPAYQSFMKRAYFSQLVQATTAYRIAVGECVQSTGTMAGCDAGSNNIPAPVTVANGVVASLTVENGVIKATPVAEHGIESSDTYVLTPFINGGLLMWASSGGAVEHGYTE